jgi:hypothetical protein
MDIVYDDNVLYHFQYYCHNKKLKDEVNTIWQDNNYVKYFPKQINKLMRISRYELDIVFIEIYNIIKGKLLKFIYTSNNESKALNSDKKMLDEIRKNYIVLNDTKNAEIRKIPFIFQYRKLNKAINYETIFYVVFSSRRYMQSYFDLVYKYSPSQLSFHELIYDFMPQKIKFDIDMVHSKLLELNKEISVSDIDELVIEFSKKLISIVETILEECINNDLEYYKLDNIKNIYKKCNDRDLENEVSKLNILLQSSIMDDFINYEIKKSEIMVKIKNRFNEEFINKKDFLHENTLKNINRNLTNLNTSVIITNQSRIIENDYKHSYHLIIDGVYCNNIYEVKKIVNTIINEIKFTEFYIFNTFIDRQIYGKAQHFRLINSVKENNNKKLWRIVTKNNIIADEDNIFDIYKCNILNNNDCYQIINYLSKEEYKELISSNVNIIDSKFNSEVATFMDEYLRKNDYGVSFQSFDNPFYKFKRYTQKNCILCDKLHRNRGLTMITIIDKESGNVKGIKYRCDFTDRNWEYLSYENYRNTNESSIYHVQTNNKTIINIDKNYNISDIETFMNSKKRIIHMLEDDIKHVSFKELSLHNIIFTDISDIGCKISVHDYYKIFSDRKHYGFIDNYFTNNRIIEINSYNIQSIVNKNDIKLLFVLSYRIYNRINIDGHNHKFIIYYDHEDLLNNFSKNMTLFNPIKLDKIIYESLNIKDIEKIKEYKKFVEERNINNNIELLAFEEPYD